MVWLGELPLCAAYLFKTDANIAIINHVVSNPTVTGELKELRSQAIDHLLECLTDLAYMDGFKMVSAASNVARLNERYEKLGFTKLDENEVHYGRRL